MNPVDRILVVDDSPDNLFLIQSILKLEGHEICTANNGWDALERIDQQPPDLILLDVMMPGIDGFEVTRRIKANPQLPFIPIALITAHQHPSAVMGLDMGADEFIRKPIEVDELLARVRSLLRLKHSVDERNEIARQQEDFVSRLTHDLRTPLVATDRLLDLMQQGVLGALPPAMGEAIQTMSQSNRNLLAMVNTLLELYRYEAQRKTLNFRDLDLVGVIQEVIQELSPLAQEKALEIKFVPGDPVMLQGDRLELRRVVTNLISNAIKFTDQGYISLQVQRDPQGNRIHLWVQDTGCGMDAEEQSCLFERFRQGRHGRAGSGLGLHLSKRIVEAHHGTIAVQSTRHQGSLFQLTLPTQQPQDSPDSP